MEPDPTCVSSVECDRGELGVFVGFSGVLLLRGARSRGVSSLTTVDDGARLCRLGCLGLIGPPSKAILLYYRTLILRIRLTIREGFGRSIIADLILDCLEEAVKRIRGTNGMMFLLRIKTPA